MLVNRRKHVQVDPKRPLHWLEPYIAREHRRKDLRKGGLWVCACHTCDRVRDALFAKASFEELGRIWRGAR